MKSSTFSRTLELAKLAAQVGLKEFRSGDIKSRYEQAVLIAKSLSQLKGAAMKVGQLLSLDLDNYFPPEAIEVLSQLQNAAVAHPFEDIEKILDQELKKTKMKKITSIDRKPLGVASIGQVHRAKLNNQDIVLKVQYQQVADSIESDLKVLKTLATSFCQITGRKMNLDPLFKEFESILEQELDYKAEAQFQKIYAQNIKKLNQDSKCQYRVPAVIDEFSTRRVLTMNFESGVTFKNWLRTNPDEASKKKVAEAVLDLYFHEFFEWGLVQTDPNWGNFLIQQEKSKISLCLLDFGASRKYSKDFILNYITLLDLAANNKNQELKKHAIELGIIDGRESKEAFEAFEVMLKTAIKPFFIGKNGQKYFDFADKNHMLDSQTAVKKLSQELVYSPPPYKIVFLHRKLAGVYAILKSLEVKLDISSYWQMMNDLSKKAI